MSDKEFGEGSDGEMDKADYRKLSTKLGNDGYRIGKSNEEERQMQLGFDKGLSRGIALGKACGYLYGNVRSITPRSSISLKPLETILFETLPEDFQHASTYLDEIEQLVASISPNLGEVYNKFKSLVIEIESREEN